MYDKNITSMHLDVLKEIGNIGAAHAATSLSTLLNKKIDMKVPKVEMVSFDDMMDLAGGPESVVAGIYLRLAGDISGSMFFVLPVEQANRFIRKLIQDENFDFQTEGFSEIGAICYAGIREHIYRVLIYLLFLILQSLRFIQLFLHCLLIW